MNPIDGKLILHIEAVDNKGTTKGQDAKKRPLTQCELEYLSLNPAVLINRMLDQVHKMILASGTLEPAGDFALLRASETPEDQEPWKFSCGHVVSDQNF